MNVPMPHDRGRRGRFDYLLANTLGLGLGLLLCLPAWSQPPQEGTRYAHHAHRGDVVLLTNDRGRVVSSLAWSPYGAPDRGQSISADSSRYGWGGHEYNQATRLQYLGARYYSPQLGRFLGIDPAGQSASGYAALAAAPLEHVDPDGRSWESALRRMHRVRARRWAKKGAIVGAAVGIGAALGQYDSDDLLLRMAGYALSGAMLGGGIGYGVAHMRGRAHRRSILGRSSEGSSPLFFAAPDEAEFTALPLLAGTEVPPDRFRLRGMWDIAEQPPQWWNGHLFWDGHGADNGTLGQLEKSGKFHSLYDLDHTGYIGGDHIFVGPKVFARVLHEHFPAMDRLRSITFLFCECGGEFARSVMEELRQLGHEVHVRGATGLVRAGPISGIRALPRNSGWNWLRRATGLGGTPLPRDPLEARGPWKVYSPDDQPTPVPR